MTDCIDPATMAKLERARSETESRAKSAAVRHPGLKLVTKVETPFSATPIEALQAHAVSAPPPVKARMVRHDEGMWLRYELTECGQCKNGWEVVADEQGRYTSIQCRRCGKLRRIVVRFNQLGLLVRHADMKLSNFNVAIDDDINAQGARRRAQAAVEAFLDAVKAGQVGERGVLLSGRPGIGKTHLLVGLAKDIARLGGPECRYVAWMTHIRALQTAIGKKGNTSAITAKLSNVPLLILDELGSGRLTPFEQAAIDDLICHRYDARLPTVAATNYELGGDKAREGDLASRIGPHAYSRLISGVKTITMGGTDQRQGGVS